MITTFAAFVDILTLVVVLMLSLEFLRVSHISSEPLAATAFAFLAIASFTQGLNVIYGAEPASSEVLLHCGLALHLVVRFLKQLYFDSLPKGTSMLSPQPNVAGYQPERRKYTVTTPKARSNRPQPPGAE